ncbi:MULTISPECIES: NADPH-dependent FMN reductase [unclassified Streptomyces]|uniref:NADPH-dependent FMN reductase n=1 Tax=unclassified Streptomyces TaxID=2593676 RepID=UPI002259524D|nr:MULTISPECIES: NADPH-dependent FMN reductase [unclassified Streptomyces]MCX4834336.1 NAD(P)H-dependent oxidoreductase [Streptomyces sp. NBC_01016]WSQ76540.1 NAD(P)H-dependent oxidoreductase [Streptomyces sp. NBC_01213]WSQ83869.1 NAD(P)H-dependent oxidoreductase [Streptomyces sp. NBC_01212]
MSHLVVGIGGTTRVGSSSELAVRTALAAAEVRGARTLHFGGDFLAALPHYAPERPDRSKEQRQLVEAVRQADGIVIGSPGYHGGISGLVKNAVDLLEDLRDDTRVYFDGRAVGLVVTAAGWQACGTTLSALRNVVHAMRGWPTPLGVTLNSGQGPLFTPDGTCTDKTAAAQLDLLGHQVHEFAARFSAPAPAVQAA